MLIENASVEMMSTALAYDVDTRNACRLAIAKWDSFVDTMETKKKEAMEDLCGMLEKLKKD